MNEREMQSLLALAAKRLHTTPEALRAAAENGDLHRPAYVSNGFFLRNADFHSDRDGGKGVAHVELASSDDLYAHTLHPYSKALLSAVPIPDPSAEAQKHRQILSGDVPSPINTPKGCNFAGRCPVACDKCRESKPQLREIRPGHFCACHLVEPEI